MRVIEQGRIPIPVHIGTHMSVYNVHSREAQT